MKTLHQFNRELKPRGKHRPEKSRVIIQNRSGLAALKQEPSQSKDLILVSLFEDHHTLPLKAFWKEARRVLKPEGNIVFVGNEPVLSRIRLSTRLLNHEYVFVFPECIRERKKFKNIKPIPVHLGVLVYRLTPHAFWKPQLAPKPHHKNHVISKDNFIFEHDYSRFDFPYTVLDNIHHHKEYEDPRLSNPYEELYSWIYETYSPEHAEIFDLSSAGSYPAVASLKTHRNYTGHIYHTHHYYHALKTLEWVKKHIHSSWGH